MGTGSSFEQEEVANPRLPRRPSVAAAREPATGQCFLFKRRSFFDSKKKHSVKSARKFDEICRSFLESSATNRLLCIYYYDMELCVGVGTLGAVFNRKNR
ncbi:hypothetical protein J6590_095756 [Homalodisca vitripennis]|nr:hypothetical protein J6590_095756 [Homalodisca vitripennis]